MKQLISPDHGRRVGIYDEDKHIMYKYGVKKSKHFFRKANSWGIDAWIINDFLPDDAIIILHSVEEGIYYKTTRKVFKENGKYLNYLKHSLQMFLSLEHWTTGNRAL